MGKLDDNKKQKQDALLETAFQLFMTKGISKTSISDIVEHAGVAKGTFYLYFKDKYDIYDRLICHKASELFRRAAIELSAQPDGIPSFEDRMVFIINSILNQLIANPDLLKFISKNLSWGIFKTALSTPVYNEEFDFSLLYTNYLARSLEKYSQPEIMLFTIVEFVSSVCYSPILYKEPVDIDTMKPFIFENIRSIIRDFRIDDEK